MKSRWIRAAALTALLATPAIPAEAPKAPPLEVTGVTLRIRHRVFANFREDRGVRPRQVFQVGDTDYSAQVVRFVPDFAMNTKSHKIVTRSPEPNNPAFEIIVKEKGAPQDTTWAFLNMPPHFARTSMLAFQILRIDFKNHAPVVCSDSLATNPLPAPAAPAGGKK
jgi:hypothetical protein